MYTIICMKKLIVLVILCSVLLVHGAERVTLDFGESYIIDGKNVTLVKADSKRDTALFCVNGVNGIVKESTSNNVNGVYIQLIRLKDNVATVEISYRCKDCFCGDECNNDVCLDKKVIEDINGEVDKEPIIIKKINSKNEDIIEVKDSGIKGIIVALLIIIVLMLSIIVLWKKY